MHTSSRYSWKPADEVVEKAEADEEDADDADDADDSDNVGLTGLANNGDVDADATQWETAEQSAGKVSKRDSPCTSHLPLENSYSHIPSASTMMSSNIRSI